MNLKVSCLGTKMVSEAINVESCNTKNEGRYKTKYQGCYYYYYYYYYSFISVWLYK